MFSWVKLFCQHIANPKKMEKVNYPEFLNTEEKWKECVQNTKTVAQFEDVFYKLLDDDSLTTLDILRLIKLLEQDVVLAHGNFSVYCVTDVIDSVIRYMVTASKELEEIQHQRDQDCLIHSLKKEEQRKQDKKTDQKNSDSEEVSESEEEVITSDDDGQHTVQGKIFCDCEHGMQGFE